MHGAGQRAAAPACPPIAGPTSHVNGPALALGICFVPSAIVWFIFAYGAMTLNWLLPLNSFHLALPTLSTKPFKEMQLGKKKKKKKIEEEEKPLHNKMSFSLPAALLGCGFPNTPPQPRRRVCFSTALAGAAGDRVTPWLGTKHPQTVPIRRARPGSRGAGCLPRVTAWLQKCAFTQLSSQDPYRPFSICCYAVLRLVPSSRAG